LRTETEKALREKGVAETESIYDKLKVAQVETRLQGAQKELAELARAQREHNVRVAFDTAECELKIQMAKKEISAGLRSVSFSKSSRWMDRLQSQKFAIRFYQNFYVQRNWRGSVVVCAGLACSNWQVCTVTHFGFITSDLMIASNQYEAQLLLKCVLISIFLKWFGSTLLLILAITYEPERN
jgi:hypothetical protein